MERLSGGCAAKAGRGKDKNKNRHAAISELLIMVENVALLRGKDYQFNTGVASGSGACIEYTYKKELMQHS